MKIARIIVQAIHPFGDGMTDDALRNVQAMAQAMCELLQAQGYALTLEVSRHDQDDPTAPSPRQADKAAN
jgi:predicted secreted protein